MSDTCECEAIPFHVKVYFYKATMHSWSWSHSVVSVTPRRLLLHLYPPDKFIKIFFLIHASRQSRSPHAPPWKALEARPRNARRSTLLYGKDFSIVQSVIHCLQGLLFALKDTNSMYRGGVNPWVKGYVCFVLKFCNTTLFSSSLLWSTNFKTKHALNLWPKD